MSDTKLLNIPVGSLIVLIGPAGSGKTQFARDHFSDTRIVSSDYCRALVSDDPSNQEVSREAFDVMMKIIDHRLRNERLTVADSTALNPKIRKQFRMVARKHDRPVVGILFDTPEERCRERNQDRDRTVPDHVISDHLEAFREQKPNIHEEPFDRTYTIQPEDEENIVVRFQNTQVQVDDRGPFDIIGDLHGCLDELKNLLDRLGYERDRKGFYHPDGRKAVFIGDLTDRGPASVGCMALVMDMVEQERAYYIPGNHCNKLYRYLLGRDVKVRPGLQKTIDELQALTDEQEEEITERFLHLYETAPPYLILDEGNLVISHAGIRQEDIGEVNDEVVDFCLYGDTTDETKEDGYPLRRDWALTYRGDALVVYGHSPTQKATPVNGTINIDQGAVYGGYLTSLRYPERELVHVRSEEEYADVDGDSLREMQLSRAERLFWRDMMEEEFLLPRKGAKPISVNSRTMRRGLDRITRSDIPLTRLTYLPSEPARGMPSAEETSGLRSCTEEMTKHYQSRNVSELRVLREKQGMVPAVLSVCRSQEAARSYFQSDDVFCMWDYRGNRIEPDADVKEELSRRAFSFSWLGDQEDVVVMEGLWHGRDAEDIYLSTDWLNRDRLELEEVVNRLRDARDHVGAVDTVLQDLEDVHSDLGRLIEDVSETGRDEIPSIPSNRTIAPASDPTREKSSEQETEEETEIFTPLRAVCTNQRVILGGPREVPAGEEVWGTSPTEESDPRSFAVRSGEVDEILELWNQYDEAGGWWFLPRYEDRSHWHPGIVPAFRLVGKSRWRLSKLVSPRRWWGQGADARWAGWNSSRKVYQIGKESVRRFVGACNPSFTAQSMAAHAGLSHW